MSTLPPSDRPTGDARRFLIRLLATAAAVVVGCGLFTAVVDPYGLFRWVDVPGFNAIKPRASQMGTAFKYRVIDFVEPQTLLLGNSRVEMGWDPAQLPPAAFGRAANVALPGQSLSAMTAMADHAWARSRPKALMVGVEFFDCLESAQAAPTRPAKAGSPWAADDGGWVQRAERARTFLAETLSLDALLDAIQTLLSQHNPNAADLRRDGFQTAREYPRMQAVDGPRKLFLQRDQENARARMNGATSIHYGNGDLSECFVALDRLLDDAQARGQAVWLATYPYHARLLELIGNAGLWPAYEEWKTVLVGRVEAKQQAGLKVRLWDFGSYHRYAVESIPGPGRSKPVPEWYWEAGHFRADLGTRMFGVMLGEMPADGLFGVELRSDNLVGHLEAVRASRVVFAAAQPQVVAELAALANAACRRPPLDKRAGRCPADARVPSPGQ